MFGGHSRQLGVRRYTLYNCLSTEESIRAASLGKPFRHPFCLSMLMSWGTELATADVFIRYQERGALRFPFLLLALLQSHAKQRALVPRRKALYVKHTVTCATNKKIHLFLI